jgi:hypothetical protein
MLVNSKYLSRKLSVTKENTLGEGKEGTSRQRFGTARTSRFLPRLRGGCCSSSCCCRSSSLASFFPSSSSTSFENCRSTSCTCLNTFRVRDYARNKAPSPVQSLGPRSQSGKPWRRTAHQRECAPAAQRIACARPPRPPRAAVCCSPMTSTSTSTTLPSRGNSVVVAAASDRVSTYVSPICV